MEKRKRGCFKFNLRRRVSLKYALINLLVIAFLYHFKFPKGAQKSRSICLDNFLGCGKGSHRNIGLLLTKDDGIILETWFKENSRYFFALIVLDGSTNSDLARTMFSQCKSVHYFHESNFPNLKTYSDGELRELGHRLVTKIFGYDVWITMAHSDEFFVHSPLKVIEQAGKEGADFVKWRALHVLPHPSEYEYFLSHKDAPVTELFHHYYHYGPTKGSFLERRMFYSKPNLRWDHRQGSILPMNLRKETSIHPAYLHYKVHNLSLAAYTPDGIHRQHWNKVTDDSYENPTAKRGVGIRWKVQNLRDFFVYKFPNSSKYSHVSEYKDGKIEKYLDLGDAFKDMYECSK